MRIRNVCIYGVIIPVLLFTYAVSGWAAASKFAAEVNGVGIERQTVDAAVNNFIQNQKLLGISIKDEDVDKLWNSILDELISAELLYQESRKSNPGDLQAEIDKQFRNIKDGFPSEEDFKKTLKERGVNVEDLKEDIKKGVFIKAFLDKTIYSNIKITEEEKRKEFENNKDKLDLPEMVRASHILIRVPEGASNKERRAAKKKIEALRKEVLSGADFAELAKENSEDSSASRGGDMGYFRKTDVVGPFGDAAFKLDKGQVSKVIETRFGYHIIKVIDKQPSRKVTYKEIEKNIEAFLLSQRKMKALDKLIEELRKTSEIKIY